MLVHSIMKACCFGMPDLSKQTRRFVPFFNVSYVKSGFHLITVAPSRRLAGAASSALSMSGFVCANTPVETVVAARSKRAVRVMRDLQVTSGRMETWKEAG